MSMPRQSSYRAEPVTHTSEGQPPEQLSAWWTGAVGQGFLHRMRQRFGAAMDASVSIRDPGSFQGVIRSGRVGALKYCHIKVTACTYAHRIRQPLPHAHSVILQLSGVTEIHCGSERRQVLPGELVLINDVRHLRIENLGPVEHLLLFNPLPQGHTEAAGALLHVRHAAQSPVARVAYRWIPDACSEVDWSDLDLGHSMEDCVARLLGGVFLEPPPPAGARPGPQQGRLRHEDVLMHISHTLTDPDLGVASIAQALDCSTRTLHRLFRNAGGESIERSIRRLRIEKCAELLRTAQAGRITDLSLLYGFASPAHFSNAFRAVYGVSPSRYRLACAAVPVAQDTYTNVPLGIQNRSR